MESIFQVQHIELELRAARLMIYSLKCLKLKTTAANLFSHPTKTTLRALKLCTEAHAELDDLLGINVSCASQPAQPVCGICH